MLPIVIGAIPYMFLKVIGHIVKWGSLKQSNCPKFHLTEWQFVFEDTQVSNEIDLLTNKTLKSRSTEQENKKTIIHQSVILVEFVTLEEKQKVLPMFGNLIELNEISVPITVMWTVDY